MQSQGSRADDEVSDGHMKELQVLAEQGDPSAQHELFKRVATDKPPTRNYLAAIEWGERYFANPLRDQRNLGWIAITLGDIYAYGHWGIDRDEERIPINYERAAYWYSRYEGGLEYMFNLLKNQLKEQPDWAAATDVARAIRDHCSQPFVGSLYDAVREHHMALASLNIELATLASNRELLKALQHVPAHQQTLEELRRKMFALDSTLGSIRAFGWFVALYGGVYVIVVIAKWLLEYFGLLPF